MLLMVSESISDENWYLVLLSSAISSELSFVVKFNLLNSHWSDSIDELNVAQLVWKLRVTLLPSTLVTVSASAGAKISGASNAKEYHDYIK